MSTNYYAHTDVCPHCNRSAEGAEGIHIGKSSGGWRFSMARWSQNFHGESAHPELFTYSDWISWLVDGAVKIIDEYGRETTLTALIALIEAKAEHRSHGTNQDGPVDLMAVNQEFC